MPQEPELSVVIPTYNRLETLRHVIPSLLRNSLAPELFEIVVADSNSNDGTAEYLAQAGAEDPRVRHLPGPYSGRAMARNAGIAAARGEVVMFTDADIIASETLLERHLTRHRSAGGIAVVGMELQVDSLATYERLLAQPAERRPLHPDSRRRLTWLYFLTGNASVRRSDLERVGRFDEGFTGYGHEDLELGYRLEAAGDSNRLRTASGRLSLASGAVRRAEREDETCRALDGSFLSQASRLSPCARGSA